MGQPSHFSYCSIRAIAKGTAHSRWGTPPNPVKRNGRLPDGRQLEIPSDVAYWHIAEMHKTSRWSPQITRKRTSLPSIRQVRDAPAVDKQTNCRSPRIGVGVSGDLRRQHFKRRMFVPCVHEPAGYPGRITRCDRWSGRSTQNARQNTPPGPCC